jgi:iron complex transport system substrate-binding protein
VQRVQRLLTVLVLRLLVVLMVLAMPLRLAASNSPIHQAANSPTRIVSLVPSATEMLFAIGAGPRVVGVSSYDTYPPQVKNLPSVGALVDPDLERILSLKPDLVVVYASQTDLNTQLAHAGIPVFEYRHEGLADVLTTIEKLGNRVGDSQSATRLSDNLRRGLAEIRRKAAGLSRPRTLLVFGRERLALRGIYASGGIGFLNDMLEIAGGTNVFADVKQQNVQASTEQILAARPDVILEVRAANESWPAGDRDAELNVWKTLASVPAVRSGRVIYLSDDRLVIPGPRIVEGVQLMAKALHPGAF